MLSPNWVSNHLHNIPIYTICATWTSRDLNLPIMHAFFFYRLFHDVKCLFMRQATTARDVFAALDTPRPMNPLPTSSSSKIGYSTARQHWNVEEDNDAMVHVQFQWASEPRLGPAVLPRYKHKNQKHKETDHHRHIKRTYLTHCPPSI